MDKHIITFTRKQVTEGGFERVSGVTDVEQVSYVGSPYLPRCVRTQWGKEMTSNKHRSSESAKGSNTIKDDLSEAITLRYRVATYCYYSSQPLTRGPQSRAHLCGRVDTFWRQPDRVVE